MSGIGKFYLAKSIVKALNCLNKEKEGLDFCGECKNCKMIEKGDFVDFIVVKPEGNFIKLEQIKEVIERSNFVPLESDKKIIVIDEVDKMNRESANSLLKTLEEPPKSVTFFLITSKLNRILPTVKSRCQVFEFSPPGTEEVTQFLMKFKNMSYDDALLLTHFFEGSIGNILNFNIEKIHFLRKKILTFFIEALDDDSSQDSLLNLIDEISSKDYSIDEFLKFLLFLLRDVFIVKIGLKGEKLYFFEKLDLILILAKKLSYDKIFALFFKISEFEEKKNLNLRKDVFLFDLFFTLRERDSL